MKVLNAQRAPNAYAFYGLSSQADALNLARQVCACLDDNPDSLGVALLLETACAETQLGSYPDHYTDEGHGLLQADNIGLKDVLARCREHHRQKVREQLGFDVANITASDLQTSPLKAMVIARLHYKLRPEPIPESLEERAHYWKQFYNSTAGAGTPEHYLKSAKEYLYQGWLSYQEPEL